jgi:lysophospholipase L1-like esterase
VNEWIRSGKAFDGIIDTEAAVRDPDHPTRLRPDYDSGDHGHLNDAGYRAMADSIDLKLFANP